MKASRVVFRLLALGLVALSGLALAIDSAAQTRAPRGDQRGSFQAMIKSAPVSPLTNAPSLRADRSGANQDLWLDESRIAVFSAHGAGRPVLRGTADFAAAKTLSQGSGATTSPVYVDRSGQPRALPGGVIVTMPSALDADSARRMLSDLGLTPSRRLGARLWLVESPAGTPSLTLAEQIAKDGRFEAVEPNWWAPPVLK